MYHHFYKWIKWINDFINVIKIYITYYYNNKQIKKEIYHIIISLFRTHLCPFYQLLTFKEILKKIKMETNYFIYI